MVLIYNLKTGDLLSSRSTLSPWEMAEQPGSWSPAFYAASGKDCSGQRCQFRRRRREPHAFRCADQNKCEGYEHPQRTRFWNGGRCSNYAERVVALVSVEISGGIELK